jgi:sugar phosphate permease
VKDVHLLRLKELINVQYTFQTMVFTHLPSSLFLALLALPPTLLPSLVLLVLRASTQSMDTAPRSAFLAAALQPSERTAVIGFLNIVRTVAQTLSPLLTGVLVERRLFWVAFVVAGSLKVAYDLGMLAVFGGFEKRRGRGPEEAVVSGTRGDEDD